MAEVASQFLMADMVGTKFANMKYAMPVIMMNT